MAESQKLEAMSNFTDNYNGTNSTFPSITSRMDVVTLVSVVCYGIICFIGLLGNGLVVFVVARYTNMKTVTNLYILNLSIADWLFLLGLPLIVTTSILKSWIFGDALCKIYYMLTCINMFTSSFTLVAMSIDRYLAVCHPVTSIPYRTRTFALCTIAAIWIISAVVILPVLLYTQTTEHRKSMDKQSCKIEWPSSQAIMGETLFAIYTLLLGWAIPVILICVLYSLLLHRLRSSRHTILRRRSQRRVTRLVSTVIAVFVCSWLPYWAFQVFLITHRTEPLKDWHVAMFQCFTILSYANSMINPLLYAFTNDHFRQAFKCAFHCAEDQTLLRMQRRDSDYTSVRRNSNTNGDPMTSLVPRDHTSHFIPRPSVVIELPNITSCVGEKYTKVELKNGEYCTEMKQLTVVRAKNSILSTTTKYVNGTKQRSNGVLETDFDDEEGDIELHDTATQTDIPYEKKHVTIKEEHEHIPL